MRMNDAVKFFSDVKERFWIKKEGRSLWRRIDARPGLGGHRQPDAGRQARNRAQRLCRPSLCQPARAHRKQLQGWIEAVSIQTTH